MVMREAALPRTARRFGAACVSAAYGLATGSAVAHHPVDSPAAGLPLWLMIAAAAAVALGWLLLRAGRKRGGSADRTAGR